MTDYLLCPAVLPNCALLESTAATSIAFNYKIGMISRRLARWAREQEQLPPGAVGHHKVEKDKCECQTFLSELGVGVVPIVGEWRPQNWNVQEFRSLIETTPFPIIVKLGHIQQSIGLKIFKVSALQSPRHSLVLNPHPLTLWRMAGNYICTAHAYLMPLLLMC